jgi:predicted nucleotidyltransferase
MNVSDERWNSLPEDTRDTLRAFVKGVTTSFGDALETVLLHGSAARGDYLPGRSNLNLLLVVEKHDLDALRRSAATQRRWSRDGIVVPLVVTGQELRATLDLFPLDYLELRQYHLVLDGRDPFVQIDPDRRSLSRQCAQEIRSNLLRTRQRFVEGGATSDVIEALLPISVTSLLPCLRALAYMKGRPAAHSTESFLEGIGSVIGVDCGTILEAWRVKAGTSTPGKHEMPRLLERYLVTLEQLAESTVKLVESGS